MDEKNLDIYGHKPIPWSRALNQLEAQTREVGRTCWLATTSPQGKPHVAAVGALWVDGVTPSAAVGVATAEPHGATRWRFTSS